MSYRTFWGCEVPPGAGKEVEVDEDRLNVAQVRRCTAQGRPAPLRRGARRAARLRTARTRLARAGGSRTLQQRRRVPECQMCSPTPRRQVALGADGKEKERVTVFVTTDEGEKFALGSLYKVRAVRSPPAAMPPCLVPPCSPRARPPPPPRAHAPRRRHRTPPPARPPAPPPSLPPRPALTESCPHRPAFRAQSSCDQFSLGKALVFAAGTKVRAPPPAATPRARMLRTRRRAAGRRAAARAHPHARAPGHLLAHGLAPGVPDRPPVRRRGR